MRKREGVCGYGIPKNIELGSGVLISSLLLRLNTETMCYRKAVAAKNRDMVSSGAEGMKDGGPRGRVCVLMCIRLWYLASELP